MSVLVTTLRSVLATADGHLSEGRLGAALRAYEDLLERSQARTDRAMEVVARSMLAQCRLRSRDVDGAREQLHTAARVLDPLHLESHARYRRSLCRLAVEEGLSNTVKSELRDYLAWAEAVRSHAEVLDACMLLARTSSPEDRIDWLQRGIDHALNFEVLDELGGAYNDLAAALDQAGRLNEALEAYQQSLTWHERNAERGIRGAKRGVVGAGWAVGALANRLEEWPLSRIRLEEALAAADGLEDTEDLAGWITAELAIVHEAAGDVVEARRLCLRALKMGREQALDAVWPERWQSLCDHARRLELDPG
jgi:tetratricopeptide (TPR) repeat protein